MAARTSGTEMGSSAAAERVSHAPGRRTARAHAARSALSRLLRDCEGVTAIEYGLLVALMTLAVVVAINTLGQQALTQLFQKVATSL
jgi:Flp pilus assembly pilin Flp